MNHPRGSARVVSIDVQLIKFDGVPLWTPSFGFEWPHPTFDGFPSCCGVGSGGTFLDRLVPDRLISLTAFRRRVELGPACFVHDWMWRNTPATWKTFRESNRIFLQNMLFINSHLSQDNNEASGRVPVIYGYFLAVSSLTAAAVFFCGD